MDSSPNIRKRDYASSAAATDNVVGDGSSSSSSDGDSKRPAIDVDTRRANVDARLYQSLIDAIYLACDTTTPIAIRPVMSSDVKADPEVDDGVASDGDDDTSAIPRKKKAATNADGHIVFIEEKVMVTRPAGDPVLLRFAVFESYKAKGLGRTPFTFSLASMDIHTLCLLLFDWWTTVDQLRVSYLGAQFVDGFPPVLMNIVLDYAVADGSTASGHDELLALYPSRFLSTLVAELMSQRTMINVDSHEGVTCVNMTHWSSDGIGRREQTYSSLIPSRVTIAITGPGHVGCGRSECGHDCSGERFSSTRVGMNAFSVEYQYRRGGRLHRSGDYPAVVSILIPFTPEQQRQVEKAYKLERTTSGDDGYRVSDAPRDITVVLPKAAIEDMCTLSSISEIAMMPPSKTHKLESQWYWDGKRHRGGNLPAYCAYELHGDGGGSIVTKLREYGYYIHGSISRQPRAGPAIMSIRRRLLEKTTQQALDPYHTVTMLDALGSLPSYVYKIYATNGTYHRPIEQGPAIEITRHIQPKDMAEPYVSILWSEHWLLGVRSEGLDMRSCITDGRDLSMPMFYRVDGTGKVVSSDEAVADSGDLYHDRRSRTKKKGSSSTSSSSVATTQKGTTVKWDPDVPFYASIGFLEDEANTVISDGSTLIGDSHWFLASVPVGSFKSNVYLSCHDSAIPDSSYSARRAEYIQSRREISAKLYGPVRPSSRPTLSFLLGTLSFLLGFD
jgi:hypothetical protein